MIPSLVIERLFAIDRVHALYCQDNATQEEYHELQMNLEASIPGWYVYFNDELGRHCIAPSGEFPEVLNVRRMSRCRYGKAV